MKKLLLVVLLTPTAFAQWTVNDQINTVINTGIQSAQIAKHVEVLRQWATQPENLKRQIRQVEDQLRPATAHPQHARQSGGSGRCVVSGPTDELARVKI